MIILIQPKSLFLKHYMGLPTNKRCDNLIVKDNLIAISSILLIIYKLPPNVLFVETQHGPIDFNQYSAAMTRKLQIIDRIFHAELFLSKCRPK